MAARPYWQGQIRLALVSIPVQIFTATRSGSSVTFKQIHEPSGKPIKYEKVVPGLGAVDPDEIKRGFEYSKGSYVLLEDDELDAVRLESKKTLELTQFVDSGEIDVLYYEKPYFVVPADDLAEEAFIVLREALRRTKKVALGQLAMRGREYVVSLKPFGRGLIMETLRYADELNKAGAYFHEIGDATPDDELLDLAETLIAKKSTPFDPAKFHDHYVEALKQLVDEKLKAKGKTVTPEDDAVPTKGGTNVIDLMAALKRSIEKPGGKEAVPAAADPPKPARKKAAAKPEPEPEPEVEAPKKPARKRAA